MKTTVDVKTIALNRAVALLSSLGAQYKIIMPDGGTYGALEVVEPKKPGAKYGHGVLRNHARQHMVNMVQGDVIQVPVDNLDVDSVQTAIANYARHNWGLGSVVTSRSIDRLHVEVLRVL